MIILAVTVLAGVVLYVIHRIGERKNKDKGGEEEALPEVAEPAAQECCGLHITCEKDSLLQGVSTEIEYYDDEELDAYKGVAADAYSDEQIEEFRDVLLTLLPHDIAGWARSLQLRGIELPEIVMQEMLLMIAEERAKSAVTSS